METMPFVPTREGRIMRSRLPRMVALFALLIVPSLVQAQDKKPAVRVEHDLVYGKGGSEEMKLDLAMPSEGQGPFPALVCVHGGGWTGGRRQDLDQTIASMA